VVTAFDILLIIVAFGIMLAGLYRRWSLQRENREIGVSGDWSGLGAYLAGHRRIAERQPAGLMHLLLVWGSVIFLLAVILAQLPLTVGAATGRGVSLLLDIAGIAMLVATLYFLIRRLAASRDGQPRRTILPMILLLVIVLSGFMAEGARLMLVPAPVWTAPGGALAAMVSPVSPQFMQAMIRVHFFSVLLLIALIPVTFMRHLVCSARNVLYGSKQPCAAMAPLALEQAPYGPAMVGDLSADRLRDADACVACGRCDEHCPALISGKPLSPRAIMAAVLDQVEQVGSTGRCVEAPRLEGAVSADALWSCTTCMACVAQCPVYNQPLAAVLDLRRHLVLDSGALPAEAKPMIRSLELFGDVNGKGVAHRTDWAIGSRVPAPSEDETPPDVLFWVGCSGAFHPAYQEVSRAMVKIFEKAGVRFAILGDGELCCGDPARRLGREDLFVSLARKNIGQFAAHNIHRIVTLCPHCYNTLKNEYPALGADIEVLHGAEYAARLIDDGRIVLKYPFMDTVTIHDPCYLGRYNGIYEPLRKVCAALPGVSVRELARSREQGFCCGGGGGRMWLHESIGEKINVVRARQVADSGAGAVATAGPYCLTMMEDGLKALEMDNTPVVRDIIEIVADSLA
jgi:Fe-S oxidoreductase